MMEDRPLFNGNLFEYEGGIMYFPQGIDGFCNKHNVEVVEIREDGAVWVMFDGDEDWSEWPVSRNKPKLGLVGK
jgi:hypothetical protein